MGTIEYEITGRVFKIPEFDIVGWNTIEEWTLANHDQIVEAIANALTEGLPTGIEQVPVFSIKGADIVMLLDRDSFEENIDRCIQHFIEIEDFERCAQLEALRKKHIT